MKHYDKFYEVENNRYYTINADGDLYIATESVLKIGKTPIFRRDKHLTQGFKLLKVSSPIATLFTAISDLKPQKGQDQEYEDMIRYEKINNDDIQSTIVETYNQVFEGQKELLKAFYDEQIKTTNENYKTGALSREEYTDRVARLEVALENDIKVVDKNNPLLSGQISMVSPIYKGDLVVKGMLNSGLNHLYTERITTFVSNIFLYNVDVFGKVTIYRLLAVKNKIKSVDTFVYDRKLINEFLNHVYENNK